MREKKLSTEKTIKLILELYQIPYDVNTFNRVRIKMKRLLQSDEYKDENGKTYWERTESKKDKVHYFSMEQVEEIAYMMKDYLLHDVICEETKANLNHFMNARQRKSIEYLQELTHGQVRYLAYQYILENDIYNIEKDLIKQVSSDEGDFWNLSEYDEIFAEKVADRVIDKLTPVLKDLLIEK